MRSKSIMAMILVLLFAPGAFSNGMEMKHAKMLSGLRQAKSLHHSLVKDAESAFPDSKPKPMQDRIGLFKKLSLGIKEIEGFVELRSSKPGESRCWNEWSRMKTYGISSPTPAAEAGNFLEGPGGIVYPYNGEFYCTVSDIGLPKRGGIGFEISRFYSSHLDYDGPFGKGWDFNYNSRRLENSLALPMSVIP